MPCTNVHNPIMVSCEHTCLIKLHTIKIQVSKSIVFFKHCNEKKNKKESSYYITIIFFLRGRSKRSVQSGFGPTTSFRSHSSPAWPIGAWLGTRVDYTAFTHTHKITHDRIPESDEPVTLRNVFRAEEGSATQLPVFLVHSMAIPPLRWNERCRVLSHLLDGIQAQVDESQEHRRSGI